MFTHAKRAVVVTGVMLTVLVSGSTAASAAEDFGQHVRTCAQTMGFNGAHNPGMHQGRSGWDPNHACA